MPEPGIARDLLAELRALTNACSEFEALPTQFLHKARVICDTTRKESALRQAASIPAARLKETARGLRLDALERAGFKTVADLAMAEEWQLLRVPGVGESTARQAIGAARQVVAVTEQSTVIRFNVDERPANQTELLSLLRKYDTAIRGKQEAKQMTDWLRQSVGSLPETAEPATRSWAKRLLVRSNVKDAATQAVSAIEGILAQPQVVALRNYLAETTHEIHRRRLPDEVWEDYERNAAQLLGVLSEVIGVNSESSNRGHLPAEIAERVEAFVLDQSLLKASLRGYQGFGAKYALVQGRTILGDEMGLGKTVEALAAVCHLAAHDNGTALVVCPASVVANWRAEIHRHTSLTARVIHGAGRDSAERAWHRSGGVAITTFDGLRRLTPTTLSNGQRIAMLIVDEAHYVKNPATKRSQAVADWAPAADHVLFLTGTPMENRVEEFRALVDHLQPSVARLINPAIAMAGPAAFQAAVAPAYLRRNQIDVLAELPEMIQSLDWVDPTAADLLAYRNAVSSGAFMAMRRAAYRSISDGGPQRVSEIDESAKLARLIDIAEEATAEGLKLVVFSFFRDVLDTAYRALSLALPGSVYGPLTGSVAPSDRQRMVEQLTQHDGGAALVAQIEAGGVGLNIQAASVVVLCEPQWKPTVEAQAIARAHRMGQVRRVQVHRLLLDESVDVRMLAVLAAKQRLIDQFVLESAIKNASPDAIDISDLKVVETVVDEAQAEAAIIEWERRRMGIVGADVSPAATSWAAPEGRPIGDPNG